MSTRALVTAALVALMSTTFAATASQAADEELIVNGGFESGLTGWFVNNGNASDGAALSLTTDAFSGSNAVLTTGRQTTGSGPMQDLSGKVTAGGTYTIKARIKYTNPNSPATKQFFATMHYGGSTYTNLGTVTPARGQWGYINTTFTIPANQSVATARLFLETPWTQTPSTAPDTHLMDFIVDDVSLVGTAPPPPPTPGSKTIEVVGKLPGDHNPLIGHKFGADGFGYAENGRVYMFMTNDTQGYAPDANTGISPGINYGNINQITLISSEDMVNWVDHGEIQVAGPQGIAPYTNNSWAPGFAKKTINGVDKYFLYYANGGGSSNVIVGDSPLGPWTNVRSSTLINGSTPGAAGVSWLFDPAPFVDDDGEEYLYFGGGPASTSFPASERFNNPKNIRGIGLASDMVNTEGTAFVVDAPVAFEAAHVFKREDKYYLSYSSHFGGNDFGGNQTPLPGYPGGGQIGYMMSDDPTVWTAAEYAGVMFPNQSQFFGAGTGGNNHQSVFEFEGKYYFTYHAPTLNKRITGDTTQGYRSPHIQELNFNEDGTVQQVVGTYAGADQVRNFDPFRVFEAETFGWSKGIATEKVSGVSTQFGNGTPNLIVKDIDNGDWTALSAVDFGTEGAASVTVKVKPLQAGGQIQVRAGSNTGTVLATLPVSGTTGEWTELTASLTGAVGVHDVYFTYSGPAGDLFELDTWEFSADEPQPGDIVVDRIAGANRYEVAVNISQEAYPDGAPVVYVASGENYPDALSAGPAAANEGGPLLLVRPNEVPAVVAAELDRLDPERIVVVGGTASVNADVYFTLTAKADEIDRVAGANRFEVSRNLAEYAFGDDVPFAYIATGEKFPDALAAGGAAGTKDAPVILVGGSASTLDDATADLLEGLGTTDIRVLGGEASVTAGILTDLEAIGETVRLGGANRYEAARAINSDAFDSAEHALIATGLNFPDALAGSAWAAAAGAPLYVVPGTCVTAGVLDDLDTLGVTHVTLLGGEASLTPEVFALTSC
ncbi:cell wall-binding repeat-containing protein [Antiquaquibacter oligotrophicus]|uniref:cell wall-binding repeat-containing protein n=1 Tax=Antiquaquibacter oligotrophicus TaxID=2880260 RepID=UPI002AC90E59|nr:cell wall-binding repeat-containing protein [Antiquaquibacter oligotrophicus]UDF12168.1 cell wall-binding repeat-containing protein [Antiquaquibacter oligotrophicus]